jgi:cytochrome c-type biogenesis protein
MLNVSILSAFLAGIISFVSPCVLPLIPAYLSFVSGLSIEQMKSEDDRWKVTRKVSLNAFLFILGFSVVFVSLGASATFLGSFLRSNSFLFNKIAGMVIVIFGLHLLGIFRIPWLYYEKRFHTKDRTLGILTPFILGLAFAFGWTPCVGPILAGVLLLASNQDTIFKGMILLASYSAGLGIPFLVAGVGFNLFLDFFQKAKKHFRAIEAVSGLFLILIGVLIFFGSFGFISEFLYKLSPQLDVR